MKEAESWKNTPYAEVGGNSEKGVGGDCSGTVYKIYQDAGLEYPYHSASNFPQLVNKGYFKEITGEEALPGDVIQWPGHTAIYVEGRGAEAKVHGARRSGIPYTLSHPAKWFDSRGNRRYFRYAK